MSSPLKQNTTTIQELLNTINTLPTVENLDAELSAQSNLISEQDAKIAELAQVLAGKAGGGSSTTSYDTCTVDIVAPGGNLYGYCATCFEEGNIVYKHEYNSTDLGMVTITNVICGSSFALLHQIHSEFLNFKNVESVGILPDRGSIFIAPSAAGTLAHITIGTDSGAAGGGSV